MFQFKTYNPKSHAFKNAERDITASEVFKKASKVRNTRFRSDTKVLEKNKSQVQNHISGNSANSPIELIDNSDNDEFPGFTLSPRLNGSHIMLLPSITYPLAVHPPTARSPLPHTTSCAPAARAPAARPPTAHPPLPHTTCPPATGPPAARPLNAHPLTVRPPTAHPLSLLPPLPYPCMKLPHIDYEDYNTNSVNHRWAWVPLDDDENAEGWADWHDHPDFVPFYDDPEFTGFSSGRKLLPGFQSAKQ